MHTEPFFENVIGGVQEGSNYFALPFTGQVVKPPLR